MQEKITVHFHTQYALCTRIRVHVYIHTGQTQCQSTSNSLLCNLGTVIKHVWP